MATYFGVFPFHLQEDGTVIDYHRSGPVKLWTTLNTTFLILYLFYQLGMITVSSVLGRVDKLGWFSQSCWLIMAIFPLPSLILYSKKRQKLCECLTQWVQLEKDLIGGKKGGQKYTKEM
jgi:hypothetical protein